MFFGWVMETWWTYHWRRMGARVTWWYNIFVGSPRQPAESLTFTHGMHGLLWAMKCLIQKRRYCSLFVTDSKELKTMVASPEEWPGFLPELSELVVLIGRHFRVLLLSTSNGIRIWKPILLSKTAWNINIIFSFIVTFVFIGFIYNKIHIHIKGTYVHNCQQKS